MTDKEAAYHIDSFLKHFPDTFSAELKKAFIYAIKVLRQHEKENVSDNENGNYIYPTDVILEEPNTATSVPQQTCTECQYYPNGVPCYECEGYSNFF